MNIGERIRELRMKNDLTQQNIADHLGINRTTYVKYETGDIDISAKVLNILADLFSVPTDYLLGRDVPANTPEDKKNNLPPLNQKDEKDISVALDKILNNLECEEALSFYGEPMDEHTKELIKLSLENSMKMAKQMAKKKFTPKKYR